MSIPSLVDRTSLEKTMSTITGTERADVLNGTNEGDNVRALEANGTILAVGGDDWITPGPGNDSGDGADLLSYEGEYDGIAFKNTSGCGSQNIFVAPTERTCLNNLFDRS